MSDAMEAVPAEVLSDDADDQEWLEDAFFSITEADHERRHGGHDREGYFADFANSAACTALGHVQPPGEQFDDDIDGEPLTPEAQAWADEHPWSWDGDRLCAGTKYGVACTACEGECISITLPTVNLWELPGVRAA